MEFGQRRVCRHSLLPYRSQARDRIQVVRLGDSLSHPLYFIELLGVE